VEHWGALLLILKGHSDVINAVQLSRDGSKLASASYDKKVVVWYLNRISRMETFIVERYVEDLAFSADEFHLKTSVDSFKLKSTVVITLVPRSSSCAGLDPSVWTQDDLTSPRAPPLRMCHVCLWDHGFWITYPALSRSGKQVRYA
jgi:hypothetical protein